MIYLLFNEGYAATSGAQHIRPRLCEEAIRLARILVRLFPSQAEQRGLLALCLLQHARAKARAAADGRLLTLEEQDRRMWDRRLIDEGCVTLELALRWKRPGPYQIQAAIAATHATARKFSETNWAEIVALYAQLEAIQPNPVVTLNRAVGAGGDRRSKIGAFGHRTSWREARSLSSLLPGASWLIGKSGRVSDQARLFYAKAKALEPTDQQLHLIDERLDELGGS